MTPCTGARVPMACSTGCQETKLAEVVVTAFAGWTRGVEAIFCSWAALTAPKVRAMTVKPPTVRRNFLSMVY